MCLNICNRATKFCCNVVKQCTLLMGPVFVRWFKFVFHQTHLAGQWRQHGSLLWPECPECQCWASFLRKNECRGGVKLTSSLPPWWVHFVYRKVALCSPPAVRSPLSSSQQTSWRENQQKMCYSMLVLQIRQHRKTNSAFTSLIFWLVDFFRQSFCKIWIYIFLTDLSTLLTWTTINLHYTDSWLIDTDNY